MTNTEKEIKRLKKLEEKGWFVEEILTSKLLTEEEYREEIIKRFRDTDDDDKIDFIDVEKFVDEHENLFNNFKEVKEQIDEAYDNRDIEDELKETIIKCIDKMNDEELKQYFDEEAFTFSDDEIYTFIDYELDILVDEVLENELYGLDS